MRSINKAVNSTVLIKEWAISESVVLHYGIRFLQCVVYVQLQFGVERRGL